LVNLSSGAHIVIIAYKLKLFAI